MVGGERDLELTLVGGSTGDATVEVVGSQLVHQQSGDVTARSVLTWDQADGDATTLDVDGLRALDLSSGGTRDALLVEIAAADAGASLVFDVGDGVGTSSFTLDLPAGATSESHVVPFADFTGSADLAAAGALTLTVDGTAGAGIDVTLDRLATVSRLEGRMTALAATSLDGGALEPGDWLEYSVVLENPSDAYGAAASLVTFSDVAPAGTALICAGLEAPTTTQGTISGCVAGENGQLEVDLGTLADGDSATIVYQVELLATAPARLCNDGRVGSATLTEQLTDDPSTAAKLDATCVIASEPAILGIDKSLEVLADNDGDGEPSPGDLLRITDVISHAGGTRDAEGLVLSAHFPDGLLETGSVTTTQGTVTSGNGAMDTSVTVDLGALAPGEQATVTYELVMDTLTIEVQDFRASTQVEGNGVWQRELLVVDGTTIRPVFEGLLDDALLDDVDGNGFVTPGDRLRFTATVEKGDRRDSKDAIFFFEASEVATLVIGSVTTTTGFVESGNVAGDEYVLVQMGSFDSSGPGPVTVTFDVQLDNAFPGDTVSHQGRVSSRGSFPGNQPSDDPETPELNDPTITPIAIDPAATASLSDQLIFDPSGDGLLQTGDRVRYTLEIANTGVGTVHRTIASIATDPAMRPDCGSITAPGAVVTACDTSAGGDLVIDQGRIPEGITRTVTWTAEAFEPAFLSQICAQAEVVGVGVDLLSDDPNVGGTEDATCRTGTLSQVLIFFDGFESGDASAWSVSTP